MKSKNWKRFLAALMAFLLFVADAPAMMAEATGGETAAVERSVSGGDVVNGVTLQQSPDNTLYYYGLTYPILSGLEISLTLSNGQTEVVSISDAAWNNYGIVVLEKTEAGDYVEYDEYGRLPAGNYFWEVTVPGLEGTLEIPFTVKVPADSPELTLELPMAIELQQKEVVYQFTTEEAGNYVLSLLNQNFCSVRIWDEEGRELYSRGLDSMSFPMLLEADRTYYFAFVKEELSSSDYFEILLSNSPQVENAWVTQTPRRTRFMCGLEMVDIYGLLVYVRLSTGEEMEVEVFSDSWWELGFTNVVQTIEGENVDNIESNELPIGDYQWAIQLNGRTILTVPFEIVDPREMAQEITSLGQMRDELTWNRTSAVFCYTPEVTACYGLELLTQNCYDLSVYGESGALRRGWIFDDTYPRVFALEAGETYYFTVNQNPSTSFGEFEFKFYSLPLITKAEVISGPDNTTFYYGLQWQDIQGLKFRMTIGGEEIEVDCWDEVWSNYGIFHDVKTVEGDSPNWSEEGRLPIGRYQWEIEVPGIEELFVIPFEVLDPANEITRNLALDSTINDLNGNGRTDYFNGAAEWIRISVEEAGNYRVRGTECFHIKVYDANGEFIQSGESESVALSFLQAGTYYAQIKSENGPELSMSKLANVTSLSIDYTVGKGNYYYGFVRDGVPGQDIAITYTLDNGVSKTVSLYEDELDDAGIEFHILLADNPDMHGDWDAEWNLPVGEYILRVNDLTGSVMDTIPLTIKDRREIPVLELNETVSALSADNGERVFFKLSLAEAAAYVLKSSCDAYDMVILNGDGELEYWWNCEDWVIATEGEEEYYIQLSSRNNDNALSVSLKSLIKAPTLSSVANGKGGVALKWSKVSGANGYIIYRKMSGNPEWKKIKTVTSGSTVTYTDKNVLNAGLYTYVVKAVKGEFVSLSSAEKQIKYLAAPAVTSVIGCNGKAKITWKQVAKATGYIVYRKTGSGNYKKIKTITGGKTVTYTDTTVKVGKQYSYVVKAVQNKAESAQGSAKSVKISKGHNDSVKVTKKATTKKNGTITNTCKPCKKVTKTTVYAAKNIKLSKDSYTYDGKAKKPTVTIKDSKGKTVGKENYTVSYKNNKNVGTATVTITFKNRYSGKVTKTFKILPKSTAISKITADSKGFTVTWKSQKTQTTGYQIEYSTGKDFKTSTKTITVNKKTTVSQKVSGLKAKKKYYVRMRTFKKEKINGKNQITYSAWSSVKTVTTKK